MFATPCPYGALTFLEDHCAVKWPFSNFRSVAARSPVSSSPSKTLANIRIPSVVERLPKPGYGDTGKK